MNCVDSLARSRPSSTCQCAAHFPSTHTSFHSLVREFAWKYSFGDERITNMYANDLLRLTHSCGSFKVLIILGLLPAWWNVGSRRWSQRCLFR